MTRFVYCITFALTLTAMALSHADAGNHHRRNTPAFAGARNEAAPTGPQSDVDVRQQHYEDAAKQLSSSNQDL